VENIIEVNNLSKSFILTTEPQTFFSFFKRFATRSFSCREIWALKNINFVVKKGEKIGIIGENGSGKTTLIRIILDIYRQTSGSVKVSGKATGFLSLGIGMQRDLSALENTYIFGAIVGLNKMEIKKKLASIMSFSELEDFLYCPLRDFSSGMQGRLAFSIAKESDSEILILDEILGAGDATFVEKCLQVLEGYRKSDKTVIMASHDIEAIGRFCDKALLLNKGQQLAFGPAEEIVELYKAHKF
jgi:ABC-type polysaccharide/polyol phosphate transport system ATPase subunit